MFVSHSAQAVTSFCEEALWLQNGAPKAFGPSDLVVDRYVAFAKNGPIQNKENGAVNNPAFDKSRFGTREIEIVSCNLYNANNQSASVIDSGEPLHIEIEYLAHKPIQSPNFIVTVRKPDKTVCFTANSQNGNVNLDTVDQRGKLTLHIERLDLVGGSYLIDVGIHEQFYTHVYDYRTDSFELTVNPTVDGKGIVNPPIAWEK
jgi:hypothetical protein